MVDLHCFGYEDAKKQELVALCGYRGDKITIVFRNNVDCQRCKNSMEEHRSTRRAMKALAAENGKEDER